MRRNILYHYDQLLKSATHRRRVGDLVRITPDFMVGNGRKARSAKCDRRTPDLIRSEAIVRKLVGNGRKTRSAMCDRL